MLPPYNPLQSLSFGGHYSATLHCPLVSLELKFLISKMSGLKWVSGFPRGPKFPQNRHNLQENP